MNCKRARPLMQEQKSCYNRGKTLSVSIHKQRQNKSLYASKQNFVLSFNPKTRQLVLKHPDTPSEGKQKYHSGKEKKRGTAKQRLAKRMNMNARKRRRK